MMKNTKKPRKSGLVVHPDDLGVGEWYAVLGLKNGSMEPVQIAGMAFRVIAMNLPFVIGRLASNPENSITFDSRYLNFMRVEPEFVAAQLPEPE